MQPNRPDIQLRTPDIVIDPPFALGWFNGAEGKATLLSMGNAENEIKTPSIETETETIHEFIALEKSSKQVTRMITVDGKTVGAVWIELFENHRVKPPSVHIIIGDPGYRGRGIGAILPER